MGKEQDDLYNSIFNSIAKPHPSGLTGLNNLRRLSDLGKPTIAPPTPNSLRGLFGSPAFGLGGIAAPIPPAPKPTIPAQPSVGWAKLMVGAMIKRKASITAGRVLPGIDDLSVMEGRKIKAAFVYSDLHGFTKLVATQPENKSFVFLHTFVEIASRITKHYGGEVMDVAGDRVLSVFQRPLGDRTNEPVEDAVTFALWLQTLFTKAVGPAFADGGLGQLTLGIGIDFGLAVVGCVGIRNNKRIVFFGDPANNAAKLQEAAGAGETVLSAYANSMRPSYLGGEAWHPRLELLPDGKAVFRINQIFGADSPPKAR